LLRQVRKPGNIARTVYIRGHRFRVLQIRRLAASARPFAAGSVVSDTGSAAHSALPAVCGFTHLLALEPEHYGGHLQAHLRRSRTRCRRCRRKGDLRGFVPIVPNREQEQPNGHVVRKETSDGSTRNQSRKPLSGSPLSGHWLRGACNHPNVPSICFSFCDPARSHQTQQERLNVSTTEVSCQRS